MQTEATDIANAYRPTVRSWDNPPKFDPQKKKEAGALVIYIVPTGNKDAVLHFEWTDLGTKAHEIRAKNKPHLLYSKSSVPKTQPGVLGSRKGSRGGAPYGSPDVVNHPGTKRRGFTDKIMDRKRRERVLGKLRRAAEVTRKK